MATNKGQSTEKRPNLLNSFKKVDLEIYSSFSPPVVEDMGLIGYTAYSPTKFARSGLAIALRMEGKQKGVAVSILYPVDVNPPLLANELQQALSETKTLNRNIMVKEAEEVAAI